MEKDQATMTERIERSPKTQRDLLEITELASKLARYIKDVIHPRDGGDSDGVANRA